MEIFLAILLFSVGIFIVVKGADFFVSASSWVADVTGISKILIGATLVAMATSGPELFVSLIAAMEGKMDISIGNVVGSHLCNLGLGFSLIAMFRPMKNTEKLFFPNGLIMILAAALLLLFCYFGNFNIVHAIIFMAIFGVFTYINIRFSEPNAIDELQPATQTESATQNENVVVLNSVSQSGEAKQKMQSFGSAKQASQTQKPKRIKKPTNKKDISLNVLKFIVGIVAIIFGSRLIVDKAIVFARVMGVSEMFIGLTIVAVGTSLPEIVTTIAAIIKKENDLGIGNIFGSCIFNNLFILALATFVTGALTFNSSTLIDLPVAILLMLISVAPTVISGRIYRWQGVSLVLIYFAYMAYLGMAN